HQCTAEQLGEPLPGLVPVAQLGGPAAGHDADLPADQRLPQRPQHAAALYRGERGGGTRVEEQLYPGVGGVHRLPARPGGTAEPVGELAARDHPPTRVARRRANAQVVGSHEPIVPPRTKLPRVWLWSKNQGKATITTPSMRWVAQ